MGEQRMPKRLFYAKTGGRRRPGKPRARWLREVNKDTKVTGIKKWWMMPLDKEEWKEFLSEARTLDEF
jgi:hypothetical protein